MYRVTTPTHTFTLPIDTSTCSEILVSYRQGNKKIDKHYENGQTPPGMTLDDENVIIHLTQEETKQFKANDFAKAQVRVLTNAGDAFASQLFSVMIGDVLNEEILNDE